jgi:hypothetical protein
VTDETHLDLRSINHLQTHATICQISTMMSANLATSVGNKPSFYESLYHQCTSTQRYTSTWAFSVIRTSYSSNSWIMITCPSVTKADCSTMSWKFVDPFSTGTWYPCTVFYQVTNMSLTIMVRPITAPAYLGNSSVQICPG